MQTYAPSRSLSSASEGRLVVPSQRCTKPLSQTFSWTVPSCWNDLPISIPTAESLAIFKTNKSFSPAPDQLILTLNYSILSYIYVTLSVKSRLKSQNLIWPYSVNIKDMKVTFSQNVLYLIKMILCRKQ